MHGNDNALCHGNDNASGMAMKMLPAMAMLHVMGHVMIMLYVMKMLPAMAMLHVMRQAPSHGHAFSHGHFLIFVYVSIRESREESVQSLGGGSRAIATAN